MRLFAPRKMADKLRKLFRLVHAVENWPRTLLDHLRLRSAPYICRLRDGTLLEVRGETDDRHTVFEVFAQGTYPVPAAEAGVVVDVGAHIGCFTLLAAKLGHRVLGVEPFPQNFEILQRKCTAKRPQ